MGRVLARINSHVVLRNFVPVILVSLLYLLVIRHDDMSSFLMFVNVIVLPIYLAYMNTVYATRRAKRSFLGQTLWGLFAVVVGNLLNYLSWGYSLWKGKSDTELLVILQDGESLEVLQIAVVLAMGIFLALSVWLYVKQIREKRGRSK